MPRMKTEKAISLAGSATALAKILGLTPGAISQWSEDVPQLRVYQLKELKPEWFTQENNSQQSDAAA